jgi:hypothetical protein
MYRLAKSILLENVQDYLVGIFQHEVFGHGARGREFGKELSYQFSSIPPFGRGGATTSWQGSPVLTLDEDAAMRIGGMEAEEIIAAEIRNRVLERRQLNYREANLYFTERLANTLYALRTDPSDIAGYNPNDIANYIRVVSRRNSNVTLPRIQSLSFLNFADPLTLEWFYSYFYQYIIKGETESGLPTLRLGKNDALLSFHFSLSPFGYDYTLESSLLDSSRIVFIAASIGSADSGQSYGLQLKADPVWSNSTVKLGGRAAGWMQPQLILISDDPRVTGPSLSLGGLASLNISYRFAEHAGLLLETGYKSRGFVAGEMLDSGPIIRGGISLIE